MNASKIEMLSAVLKTSTSQWLLQEYYNTGHSFLKRRIAQNEKLPPELITKLAKDGDYITRGYIAENPSCPVEILKELVLDKNKYVREIAKAKLKK